jgi:hypothetical protein
VVTITRLESYRVILEGDQVCGRCVPPTTLRPPDQTIGKILIKVVVLTLVEGDAVGIINPAAGGCEMKLRPHSAVSP